MVSALSQVALVAVVFRGTVVVMQSLGSFMAFVTKAAETIGMRSIRAAAAAAAVEGERDDAPGRQAASDQVRSVAGLLPCMHVWVRAFVVQGSSGVVIFTFL